MYLENSCNNPNAAIQEQNHKKNPSPEKGAEFMAIRRNIRLKRKEIRKSLTPSENYLLDDITEGTVNHWESLREFDLKELAEGLGYKSTDKLYALLKALHKKGIIIRKNSRYKGREFLGLNPEYFGQILIDHQHEIEKKKHLKLVSSQSDSLPLHESTAYESEAKDLRSESEGLTKRKLKLSELFEMIDKNRPIDSHRLYIDLNRRKKDENLTLRDPNQMTQEEKQQARNRFFRRQA